MMNDSTLYIDWMALQLAFRTDGQVVRVPGMPPMYDYEYNPQDVGMCALFLCSAYHRTGTAS